MRALPNHEKDIKRRIEMSSECVITPQNTLIGYQHHSRFRHVTSWFER